MLAALVGVALVYLGLGLTFVVDEWDFILRSADPSSIDLLRPFNGHWSAVPVLTYRALVGTIGLRTYVPYHLLTVVALLLTAGALYVLVRRRAGGLAGIAIASVYLVFGSGFENYWWGFQVGFVGSTAAGLWGFVLLDGPLTDRRRIAAAALFLLGSTASSPAAILLGGAVLASMIRRDARTLLVLAIPVAVYAVWFLATGPLSTAPVRTDAATLLQVPSFILEGAARVAGGSFGLAGRASGLIMLTVVLALVYLAARRGWRPTPTVVGLVSAGAALFASIALVRAYLGIEAVSSARYLHAAAPAVGVLLAEVVPVVLATVRRGRAQRLAAVGIVAAFEVALLGNILLLGHGLGWQRDSARQIRAAIAVMTGPGGASCDLDAVATRPEEVAVVSLPGRDALRRLIGLFGDPREDVLAPSFVVPPTAEDVAFARSLLCRS